MSRAGRGCACRRGRSGPASPFSISVLLHSQELCCWRQQWATGSVRRVRNPRQSQSKGKTRQLAGPGLVGGPQINQHTSDSHQLLVGAGVALGLMVALSIVFGWVAAGRILRPLRTITGATKHISATNLHERLNLVGPDDELKELGDTFDELLGRLDRSFQLERQFVANASHELRTPLATMRASLDVAMAKPGPPSPQMGTLAERLRPRARPNRPAARKLSDFGASAAWRACRRDTSLARPRCVLSHRATFGSYRTLAAAR